MPRSPSSLWFALTFAFTVALLVWWTAFQVGASAELEAAGQALAAGDVAGAARELGAATPAEVAEVAASRRRMFLSEGIVFAITLAAAALLFARSQRREAKAREGQDRFLAAATHELKTPLATIQLLLESLRDGRVPEAKRERWLASGLLEAKRLEGGLTNLLTAAGLRTTAHRGTPAEPGDLAEDVRAALRAVTPRAEAAGVRLEARAMDAVPLRRDPEGLQLALRNLLDNAVKFSPPGGAVAVSVAATADGAEVVVADAGRGMDEEELRHAFAPFWTGSHSSGGTGLGLHLVRELVRSHGGTVTAESPGRGHGSRFTVRLPRQAEA